MQFSLAEFSPSTVSGYDLSSVKACTSGGAPLGTSVIAEVYKRLGILVRMGYGLSETSGVTGQNAQNWNELQKLLGSTGTVFGGTEIKVRSVETGKSESQALVRSMATSPTDIRRHLSAMQVGENGEICVRSPYCAISYLNNPEATAEAFDDEGWFLTGDVGHYDASYNLWIVDRLKEIMKIKG